MGGALAWRSLERARTSGWTAVEPDDTDYAPTSRFALATAMFFAYALLLVGHGLPFWLGTALFVTAYVFVFRRADRRPEHALATRAETGSSRSSAASRPRLSCRSSSRSSSS
jgi:hypothetical protein